MFHAKLKLKICMPTTEITKMRVHFPSGCVITVVFSFELLPFSLPLSPRFLLFFFAVKNLYSYNSPPPLSLSYFSFSSFFSFFLFFLFFLSSLFLSFFLTCFLTFFLTFSSFRREIPQFSSHVLQGRSCCYRGI